MPTLEALGIDLTTEKEIGEGLIGYDFSDLSDPYTY
jgi:hypothetical protein